MHPSFRTRSRALSLATSLLFVLCAFGCGDLDDAGDDDLMALGAPVSKMRNALTPLNRGIAQLEYPFDFEERTDRIELTLLGHEWDDAWVDELLRRNERSLVFFARALEKDRFQIRVTTSHLERAVLDRWLMLARVHALSIRAQARHGDAVGALGALVDLAQFGSRLRDIEGGRIVHHLLGISMMRMALTTFERVLIDASPTPAQAAALVPRLEALRVDREGWQRILRGDYQWRRAILEESIAARGQAPGAKQSRDPFAREVLDSLVSFLPASYTLQRNRTLERLASHYRAHGELAARPCLATDSHRAPEAQLTGGVPDPMTLERNALGNYWADLAGLTVAVHHNTMCVADTFVSAIVAMVGLRAHQTEVGSMPDTLDALVPDILAAVPPDSFGAAPLRYSRAEHLLYSVGTDFADAGGVWKPGDRCSSELAWPIPFAAGDFPARPPERLICATPQP